MQRSIPVEVISSRNKQRLFYFSMYYPLYNTVLQRMDLIKGEFGDLCMKGFPQAVKVTWKKISIKMITEWTDCKHFLISGFVVSIATYSSCSSS